MFPVTAAFTSAAGDPLTRRAFEPLLVFSGERFARLRFLQQGNVHIYLLYILMTAMAGLAWAATRDWTAW